MFITCIIAILVSMALVLIRCLVGPTVYDRILAVNAFGTHTVVAIAVLGYITDAMYFLDIAVIYALINFIATIALLRYFRYGTFGER